MEQNPSNSPVMSTPTGPAGWLPVWIKALTKPSEQTFVEITQHPDATSKVAFLWMFIAGTVAGIFQAILQAIYAAMGTSPQIPIPGLEEYVPPPAAGDPGSVVTSLVISVCVSPIAGVVTMIFFAIGVAITQWIAKLFGGTGTFDKLAYATAAISVPTTLISSLLALFSAIPFVGLCTSIISLVFTFFVIYLQIVAVKAVNRFGWGAAAGSVLIPGVIVLLFCGCLVIGGLMLMGPAISDVFNQINQSLAP